MYCKARIAGHPIHPMLVSVPIGLCVAAFAALVAWAVTGDAFYGRAARIADTGGVITALVAAVPGAIDLATLERGGKARATGATHALLGLVMLLAYGGAGVALWRDGDDGGVALPLALASVGMAALVGAAAHGFALVQTHKIGVRPTHLRSVPAQRTKESIRTA
jgi:uncharacterized membrane protein